MLHTLFSLDEQYAVPTNYDCFCPRHFLVSEKYCTHLLKFPSRRPMDNMKLSWDTPQEDELAMCVRGQDSVYRNAAFPKHGKSYLNSLDFDGYSQRQLDEWKSTHAEFINYLNYKYRKTLVLKSPPHTGRIATLLEMYPNARFVHLSRSPFGFMPSTLHLWKALEVTNGFQVKKQVDQDLEFAFDCFRRIYDGYEQQRGLIPSENLVEISYEDLTSDTIGTMRYVYDQLGLNSFDLAEPRIREHSESRRDYKRNRHEPTPSLTQAIRENCSAYMDRFGYESKPSFRVTKKAA